ncbi:SigE family RNA polymerase sigma factor [Kribbella qitaiheensis]|uniref:SigE family RNA polymerase sigma factor n=1 Tax=Kribbella qitaiheensis TaxID=1544730 RepID=UPI00361B019E
MRDQDGFDEFVRARWGSTVRLAVGLTLDHGYAEDLAQEALAKLWFRWNRVADGNPDAYLRKIVLNTFLSRRRRKWWGEHATAELPESEAGQPAARTEATPTTQVDDRDALKQALRRVSPKQRVVIFLRYAEDLPEHEVAELLGCSVGTVKSHASRGLAVLRKALDNQPQEAHR